jgi:uncharacterized protein with ParB-like and HNH nuclease domain
MKILPLKKLSIAQIYNGNDVTTYEVPIYQRNYAWEKDEIFLLIQDVYDACVADKPSYYIGTLVSFNKGDNIYEVIDGQQRLTTIYLVLRALGISTKNKLTYRARTKSNKTIQNLALENLNSNNQNEKVIDSTDYGIVNGFKYAHDAIDEIVIGQDVDRFKNYFQDNVHLIHYQVPKDIDLNHYFEIMNSRGEQLEKHEIIKARLIEKLNNDTDKGKFNHLWEFCSEMNVYIQQKYHAAANAIKKTETAIAIFGDSLCDFKIKTFDALPEMIDNTGKKTIGDLIDNKCIDEQKNEDDKIDTFQPIMDFSNFLLIVLKLTRIEDKEFTPTNFNLDDKELIHEFEKDNFQINEDFVKKFGFNLLKSKYLLDNYIVHHSGENDATESNPWKLQRWQKDGKKNLYGENDQQHKLVHLLSMFEVSFTARQRKNYLFYCLLYLFHLDNRDISKYCEFVLRLADKYFKDLYLAADNLNEINTPKPGSFDSTILLNDNTLNITPCNNNLSFNAIYGDGKTISKGIPLFVFNYLDYKLWCRYDKELRGKETKKGDKVRTEFFIALGCSDFELDIFKNFYFSRTRRSLEHFYPQAQVNKEEGTPNQEEINCFGNYAMIGSEANSSGSDWRPITKLTHYLDASKKKPLVSVASLKFMIMMQRCEDNRAKNVRKSGLEWNFDDIKDHQEKMLEVLLPSQCVGV